MTIAMECPGCGKRLKFRDELAGETVECKECGEDIDLPGGRRKSSGGRRKKSRSGDKTVIIVGGVVGGLVVMGLIGILVIRSLLKSAFPEPPLTSPPVAFNPPAVQPNIPAGSNPAANPTPAPRFGPGQKSDPNAGGNNSAPGSVGAMSNVGNLNLPNTAADPNAGFGPKDNDDANKPLLKTSSSDWTAKPDTPVEKAALESNRKIAIKFSGDRPDKTSVLFPHVTSAIVAIGDNQNPKNSRDIWDLTTNSKIGSMKGMRFTSDVMALSPDGLYLAAAFRGNVDVWDVKAKKSLGQFSLGSGPWGVKFLEFPRPNQLLGLGSDGTGKLLKIPSGEVERDLQLGKDVNGEKCAISPSGKYLMYKSGGNFGKTELKLRDLDSDEVVGEILVEGTKFGSRPDLSDIAFSPKGDEVAATFEGWGGKDLVIVVWNMNDGSEVEMIKLDPKAEESLNVSHWTKYTPLVWSPNARRWLVKGHGIVDRTAKQMIYRLPNSAVEVAGSRRMLSDSIVSVVDGDANNATFVGYTLKESDLLKTAESVLAGGMPGDVQLPPLTKADWTAIEDLTHADRDGQWTVTPDPAPAPAERLLLKGMPLRQGKGEVRQVILSRADSARMFARVVDEDVQQVGRRKEKIEKETWIDVYDLAGRKATNKFKMPLPCELVSASPDGTRLLVQTTQAVGRIDVYADDGKHICGWRPYQDEQDDKLREVVGAAFIDSSHLATVNAGNKLVMWELPSCKAIYGIENAALPALTQGTKYLTFADINTYDFRDAITGKSCGEIKIEDGKGISSVAFHPNGERLAILLDDDGSLFLLDVNLKTGQASEPIPVPPDYGPAQPEAQNAYMAALQNMQAINARLQQAWKKGHRALGATMPMHWCGDDFVLLNNYRLFDVKQKVIVWQYYLPVGAHIANTTDGRHWYVTTKTAKGSGPPYLVAQTLPDKFAQKEMEGRNLVPKYLLHPGATVGLQMKLLAPPNKPNFQTDVYQAIVASLARNQVKLGENQPMSLVLAMEQRSGQSMQYQTRETGAITNVQQQFISCTASLESGGAKLWDVGTESTNALWSVMRRSDESLESKLSEGMWARPSTYFQSLKFPLYIFDKSSSQGMGVSTLTIDGTERSTIVIKK